MFDHAIFNDCMANVDFCEQMVKETNPSVLAKAEKTSAEHVDDPRLPDDRRHHAGAEPVHRRVLPRDAARGPLHARDVLPLRRAPHAPLDDHAGRLQRQHHAPDDDRLLRPPDALLRVRQAHRADARRPLRLLLRRAAGLREGRLPRHEPRLLGRLRRPRHRRLRLPDDDRVGQPALHHPRHRHQRRARHHRPRRDQRDDPDPARQLVLRQTGRTSRRGSREDPLGQPDRQGPPVEQDDDPEAAGARLHGQVQLGHLAADLRQADRHATCAATPAAARSPASG